MDCLINGAVIDYLYGKYKVGSLTCISEELVLEGTDWIKGKAETLPSRRTYLWPQDL